MQGLTLQLWLHVNVSPPRASLPHASDSVSVSNETLLTVLPLHKHEIARRREDILLHLSHLLLN